MKSYIEIKSVEQKRYRKGPSVDQPYTTIAGYDSTGDKPWLKQILEVRCDPAREDIKEGDIVEVGVERISLYNGVVQFDGKVTKSK